MALDKDTVVRAGLRLLDEVGLDGLTLRKLAAELDVQAPALYWHFRNKQELLDEMATAVFRDLLTTWPDTDQPDDWRAALAIVGTELRRALLARRDGARMCAGTYLTEDSLLVSMETPLRTLTEAGFPLRDAVRAFTTVYSFTIGFTIEEQAAVGDPRYDAQRRRERFDTEAYPLTASAGPEIFGSEDDRFAYGLNVILAGLEAAVRRG